MKAIAMYLVSLAMIIFLPPANGAGGEAMCHDSYMAHMRRQAHNAVLRADEYRARYEICDLHHRCIQVSAMLPEIAEARKREIEKDIRAGAYPYMPKVWA